MTQNMTHKINYIAAASFRGRDVVLNLNAESNMDTFLRIRYTPSCTKLRPAAKRLLLDIARDPGMSLNQVANHPEMKTLVRLDLVNIWSDDTGESFIEIGAQL